MLQFIALMLTADRKKDDRGATAVEYGLMVFLIALAIIATVTLLGGRLNVIFQQVLAGIGG